MSSFIMLIDYSCGLHEKAVVADAAISGKAALFALMGARAEASYGVDADAVTAALQQRENLGSTGFGNGIAIPHARLAQITDPVGLFVRLEKPVEYASIDERPVDLVFGLLSPVADGARHLKVLAGISRTLRDEGNLARLRGASNADAIYALLAGRYEFDAA
ncbi:MAG: PTS sugar transporter subunit IIA [Novosphingopyxis baekryungensis]|nr:PTS sugar transporter subunit IIA [Novosphingopyxis baekryungensis]